MRCLPAGITIIPTFTSGILNDPNSAAIQATVNQAIGIYHSTIADNITVRITFVKDDSLGGGSNARVVDKPYGGFLAQMNADKKSADDATAISRLSTGTTDLTTGSAKVRMTTANARALGFPDAAPASDGTIFLGTDSLFYDRGQPDGSKFDALRVIEHEIDEVLGIVSGLDNDVVDSGKTIQVPFPVDMFRYDSVGQRSFTITPGTSAFFSIDGTTRLAQFNNNRDTGDMGDYLSNRRPAVPHVQDANVFGGQIADLSVAEFTALDVTGFDLNTAPTVSNLNTVTFGVGGNPASIAPSITVADANSSKLNSATVAIASVAAEDVLAFTNDSSTMGDIAGSYNAGTGVLTLTSAAGATPAQFQAALRSVTYNNTNTSTSRTGMTVTFTVTDDQTLAGTPANLAVNFRILAPSLILSNIPRRLAFNDGQVILASVLAFGVTATGSVSFSLDGAAPLVVPLDSGNAARFPNTGIKPGNHLLTVTYPGDAFVRPSSSSIGLLIDKASRSLTIVAGDVVSQGGDTNSVQVFDTITGTLANDADGTLTYSEGGNVVGTSTVTNGASTFAIATGQFSEGVHTINVTYDGGTNFVGGASGSFKLTVDQTPPTASVTAAAPTINAARGGAGTATVKVTYADALTGVSANSFDASDITVSNGAKVSGVLVTGNTVTYTILAPGGQWNASPQGTYTVGLKAGAVVDQAGNAIAGNPALSTFVVDTVAPRVVSLNRTSPAGNLTNATSLTYTVTFSEPVTAVDKVDFVTVMSGSARANRTASVSGSGKVFTLVLGGVSGNGTVGINLADNNTIRDLAGNSLASTNGLAAFGTPQAFPTTFNQRSAVVDDVNGDGRPDLIVANYIGDTSVLLGNGNGTFLSAQSFAGGSGKLFEATGDVNGDGRVDVVMANLQGKKVTVVLGNGNGTFQPPRDFATDGNTVFVALADVNGDGRPDVIASSDNNTVDVLLGNGDGTFQAARNISTGSSPQLAAIADLNGDGRLDLAVPNSKSDTISVLLGNGDGTFQAALNIGVGTGPISVAAADFNGDGRLDLAVANRRDNTVSLLLGNGNGSFQAARNSATESDPTMVAATDVNGDGRPDLATSNLITGSVSVLLGNGDGSFQAQNFGGFDPADRPYSIALADLNGDGRLDLTLANRNLHNVNVVLANGNGNFTGQTTAIDTTSPRVVSLNRTNPSVSPTNASRLTYTARFSEAVTGVDAGDFAAIITGTSGAKITGFSGSGAVYTLTVTGVSGLGAVGINLVNNQSIRDLAGNVLSTTSAAGVFTAAQNSATGVKPFSVASGDVNGDGRADLVTANFASNSVTVLLGNGNGTFKSAQNFAAGNRPYSAALADVNGDGRVDLALANFGDQTVSVLLGNGNGTFTSSQNFTVGSKPTTAVFGDLNGDGRADLAVSNYNSNSASVLLGNGDGKFKAARNFATGRGPNTIALGDVTGDGRLDLALPNFGSNTVSVLVGIGDGSFKTAQNFGTGANPIFATLADVNGDRRLDLAVANRNSTTVSVLLGNGNGTFAAARNFNTGTQPAYVTVTDANGDGRPDLAVANYGSNTVSMLPGNGNGTFAAAQNFAVGNKPNSLTAKDLNGDGRPDLAVANYLGNTVSVLLATGNGNFAGQVTAIDQVKPVAKWNDVASPTSTAVNTATIIFTEPVQNVTPSNLTLNGKKLDTLNGVSVSTSAGIRFDVTGLAAFDNVGNPPTTFTLAVASGNTIKDLAGNPFAGTPSVSWTMDTTSPGGDWTPVPTPTRTAIDRARISWTEPVRNIDLRSFLLNGTRLSTLAGVSIIGSSASSILIGGLSPYNAPGELDQTFTLSIATDTSLQDLAGNPYLASGPLSWIVEAKASIDPAANVTQFRVQVQNGLFQVVDSTPPGRVLGSVPVSHPLTIHGHDGVNSILLIPNSAAKSGGRIAFRGGNGGQNTLLLDVTGAAITQSPSDFSATSGQWTLNDPLVVTYSNVQRMVPLQRMYRVYNAQANQHLFTSSPGEFDALVRNGLKDETSGQPGWAVSPQPLPDSSEIFRLYNPHSGGHYLTLSTGERDALVVAGWKYEQVEGYMFSTQVPGSTAIYRLYNQAAGEHLYTESAAYKDALLANFPGIWVLNENLGYGFAVGKDEVPASPAVVGAMEPALSLPTGTVGQGMMSEMGTTPAIAPSFADPVAALDTNALSESASLSRSNSRTTAAPTTAPMNVAPPAAPLDHYWMQLSEGIKSSALGFPDWS